MSRYRPRSLEASCDSGSRPAPAWLAYAMLAAMLALIAWALATPAPEARCADHGYFLNNPPHFADAPPLACAGKRRYGPL
jgi:hypothetical protein